MHTSQDGITAIIPAKGVSSRLPNKNILDFHGNPLVVHKIKQLKQVHEVDCIIVSSDDDHILELALKEGVQAVKRPVRYTLDDVSIAEFFEYIPSIVRTTHTAWTCCTSPTFDERRIRTAIALYRENVPDKNDSLISVMEYKHFLFDSNGPLNFGIGREHKYSQDLPRYDLFTNGILIAPTARYAEWGSNFGPNPFRFEVDQITAIDIDTPVDFEVAKRLWEIRK